MSDIPTSDAPVDLTKENLDTPQAAGTLALLAVLALKKYGRVTFVVLPNGGIAFANPSHVDIHPEALKDLQGKSMRFVRPLLGDGRPSFVAWKDGILWEVVPTDD